MEGMCNRVVQKGRGMVKPGGKLYILLKGPGGFFELPFEGTFAGAAKKEKRQYWLNVERAEEVIIPDVEGFEEKNKETDVQNHETLPPGSALEALLLPAPTGKDYRLLKVLTQAATPEEAARWGNDRAPVIIRPLFWGRAEPGYDEFPPVNQWVWGTDGETVRKARWTWDGPTVPLEEGKWEDETGQPITVTRWLGLNESETAPVLI
jgi:hypothetical protein